MKIILLIHQSSEMYGSDKVLLFLAEGLINSKKFHPLVVLPNHGPLENALLAVGVEVHIGEVAKISRAVFSPIGLFNLIKQTIKSFRDLDTIVAGRTVDIVHSNTLAVLSGALWATFRRKKHIWHVHEIILSPKIVSKLFPLLVRVFSNRVMSNSTLTEQWLLSHQPKLTSKSLVIFNGLPAVNKPLDALIKQFRTRIGAVDEDIIITLAGRINRWKGQELLLTSINLLKERKQLNHIKVVIVGSPAPGLEDMPAKLKAFTVAEGLEGKVFFIEFVDDIWPVWFGSDIAVVPSTEPEPFGMVAIEAMAASLPVIAAGHGGLLDIVVNGETGVLFNPKDAYALADAISRLAQDSHLRKKMGAQGAARQRELFSMNNQIDETIKVYDEMCVQ